MSNKKRRPVINAETVIIHADEVIVIEADDRRRHRKDRDDVAGVEDRRRHHDTDVLGAEENQPKRYFPW